MLLGTSRVLLEEAGELYSSIIHVYIRLKSDSFTFSNNALSSTFPNRPLAAGSGPHCGQDERMCLGAASSA
jgi:hypothetical protein